MVPPAALPAAATAASLWMLMRAFASGCTAMTGVEAVSNGVGAFREPAVANAHADADGDHRRSWPCCSAGIAYLCRAYGIGATEPGQAGLPERALAARRRRSSAGACSTTSRSARCWRCSGLSANTGFADFPRLCRLIAQDGFLPRAFAHRGPAAGLLRRHPLLAAAAGCCWSLSGASPTG